MKSYVSILIFAVAMVLIAKAPISASETMEVEATTANPIVIDLAALEVPLSTPADKPDTAASLEKTIQLADILFCDPVPPPLCPTGCVCIIRNGNEECLCP